MIRCENSNPYNGGISCPKCGADMGNDPFPNPTPIKLKLKYRTHAK